MVYSNFFKYAAAFLAAIILTVTGCSNSEINKILVLNIKEHEYFTSRNVNNEHAGGGLFAEDETIMSWLFDKHQQ